MVMKSKSLRLDDVVRIVYETARAINVSVSIKGVGNQLRIDVEGNTAYVDVNNNIHRNIIDAMFDLYDARCNNRLVVCNLANDLSDTLSKYDVLSPIAEEYDRLYELYNHYTDSKNKKFEFINDILETKYALPQYYEAFHDKIRLKRPRMDVGVRKVWDDLHYSWKMYHFVENYGGA